MKTRRQLIYEMLEEEKQNNKDIAIMFFVLFFIVLFIKIIL